MFLKSLSVAAVAGALAGFAVASVHAETFDKSTNLTFNVPVKIPGIILTPGTYRFHLTNPTTSRNVIQVLSRNGATVYSQFHTIPDYRATPTDESTVTFKETKAGAPPAIDSLFYGGERSGYEFIYPREKPVTVAQQSVEPPTPAPVPAQAPRLIAESTAPAPSASPAPTPQAAPAPEAAAAQSVHKELPKTASSLPAVMFGGFASLLLAFGVHAIRARVA